MTPPKKASRRKRTTPLSDDPESKENLETRRLLGLGGSRGPAPKYDPDFHPDDIVAYFQAGLDALEGRNHDGATDGAAERVVTEKGAVSWVAEPTRLRTLAGYAVRSRLNRKTLWRWGEQYEEFGEALELAKAIQEHTLVELAAVNAIDSRFASLLLKNWHGMADKVDADVKSSVTVVFDDQDREA